MENRNRKLPFTNEQIKKVFETNIIDFALDNGFEINKKERRNNKLAVKIKGHGGLHLFRNGLGFFCFSTGTKGNIIDFAKEYLGLNFRESIETILGCKAYENNLYKIDYKEEAKEKKDFVLPNKDNNCKRVLAYLCKTRGINEEIVAEMIKQGKIYQTRVEKEGKVYSNLDFVGYDEENNPKYCGLRALSEHSNFRMDVSGSDK